MISSNSNLALSDCPEALVCTCACTQHPHILWSWPVRRHVEWLEKDVACKANLPSDSTMLAEEGGGHSYTGYTRDIVCVRYPLCCIVYLAVYNNDDVAYRELHFAMPLTDHRCEKSFKLLVVERQIRFSRYAELWNAPLANKRNRRVFVLWEHRRVHPRAYFYYALNLSRAREYALQRIFFRGKNWKQEWLLDARHGFLLVRVIEEL